MKNYLLITEVSQKQAYIFRSKKLKNNIIASDIIRYVTDPQFYETVAGELYTTKENLVYSGGGHSVLGFDTKEKAREFAMKVSKKINDDFKPIEMFMKIIEVDKSKKNAENITELIRQLEIKKSMRSSSFSQGSFGVEIYDFKKIMSRKDKDESGKLPSDFNHKNMVDEKEKSIMMPYKPVFEFDKLGGTKGEANFIAVVHIDGNSMGKRVALLNGRTQFSDFKDFDKYAQMKKEFSEEIDKDFSDAYMEMLEEVKKQIDAGNMNALDLKENYFPVRRVVMAGDDICFVTDGRIGIECAVKYMEILNKKINKTDGKNYTACAGVAIVHQKYPFHKAYELAEELCSSAKKALAHNDLSDKACAIDWHIEYGEVYGGISDIRKSYYDKEGVSLTIRPFIACGDFDEKMFKYNGDKEKTETLKYGLYKDFIHMMGDIDAEETVRSGENHDARNKIKALRTEMRKSRSAAKEYAENSLMETIAITDYTFDAIELMDAFIRFKEIK